MKGVLLAIVIPLLCLKSAAEFPNARRPAHEKELRFWLENMVQDHRFTLEEIRAATGMARAEIQEALRRFRIQAREGSQRAAGAPLRVLPYPGGRHPRIGFLEGAVDPQRETKISVFTPWDEQSYVVADVPEAIWSQLGLIYLAHTHVPTVWDERQVRLEAQEWKREGDGALLLERKLPGGIVFGTRVVPGTEAVRMEMWLVNGTSQTLSDLRVQHCVMLKGAHGFNDQTNDNKLFRNPYVCVRDRGGERWIITAWSPCDRPWGNPPVPCLHSDPKFEDCPPGETRRLKGWLSFYEGADIEGELQRIEATGWRK